MSKTIYISGKIGEEVISDATRRKFARAEEMLKAKGYEVFNPCDDRWQSLLSHEFSADQYAVGSVGCVMFPDFYAYALLRDQMVLLTMDAIFFLEDYDLSPGATSEYYFAKAIRKRVFFQDRCDACEYLVERMYREAKEAGKRIKYAPSIETAYFEKHLDEAWLPIDGKEGGE